KALTFPCVTANAAVNAATANKNTKFRLQKFFNWEGIWVPYLFSSVRELHDNREPTLTIASHLLSARGSVRTSNSSAEMMTNPLISIKRFVVFLLFRRSVQRSRGSLAVYRRAGQASGFFL